MTATVHRSEWAVSAMLVCLSLVPAVAGTARLVQLASGAAPAAPDVRFFVMPVPVVLHIVSVIPYSILGAFQFGPEFRRRHRGWHRGAGRALTVCGVVAALSGLWMTCVYPWPEGDGRLLYVFRLLFGGTMVIAIVRAVDAVRHRDFASHGAWMIRAYAIGMGAGTQVLTHLCWSIAVGPPNTSSRALLMGAGWVINAAIAEWVIRRVRTRRAGVAQR